MPFVQQPTHDKPEFNCGSRLQQSGPPPEGKNYDGWRIMPNGDRTCSYCGSLSEEDFLQIIECYGNGEEGYKFDPSTKNYKCYANRPGVRNAGEGGIKFYGWHADTSVDPARKNALFHKAHKKFWDDMDNRNKQPG